MKIPKAYMPSSKIVIRDSIDEELSDDIEDDVFIRDGKSRSGEEKGLKRPLMARRHHGSAASRASRTRKTVAAILRQRNRCWRLCEPFCYAFAALLVLIALVFIAAFLLTMFPVALQKIKILLRNSNFVGHTFGARYGADVALEYSEMLANEMTPCTQLTVAKVWSKGFAKLNSESQLRTGDLNGDGIADVIFGFGIDDQVPYAQGIRKCEVERPGFREMTACRGGLIALDGSSGATLWEKWTTFIVFSMYCNADLNADRIVDCVASGHGGHIVAVDGRNGDFLWHFDADAIPFDVIDRPVLPAKIALFSVNGVRDVDGDNIPDVLASSIDERAVRNADGERELMCGHLSVWSGRSGKLIRTIDAPNQEEIYVPLQVITQYDGNDMIVIVTGGQSSPGGVYLLPLTTLMDASKQNEFITVYRNGGGGFMVPPVLSDLNSDGADDIVAALFNSTIFAFDGRTYATLWNFTFAESESISSIVPGHYNHDNITDFMVKYNSGPGFPIYYYSQTQIVDGRNGSALLDKSINDSGGSNSLLAGLSLSQAYGGDFFLHWQMQCRNKTEPKEPYQFVPDSDIRLQTRADTCMLRYNTPTVLNLHAISRHIESPGPMIVTSDDLLLQLNQTELKQLEKQMAVSALKHPKIVKNIQKMRNVNASMAAPPPPVEPPMAATVAPPMAAAKKTVDPDAPRPSAKGRKKILSPANVGPERETMLRNVEKPVFSGQSQMDVPLSPENIVSNVESEYEREENREQQLKKYIIESIAENRHRMMLPPEQVDKRPPEAVAADEYAYYEDPEEQRKLAYGVSSRDVRSKMAQTDNERPIEAAATESPPHQTRASPPNTLWDLELDKENADAAKDPFSSERRRRQSIDLPLINQNLLAAVTSPGVLLSPLENRVASTIDFAFVLNVRESELYPPLLLADDIKCAQQMLADNRKYSSENYAAMDLQMMERTLLKKCIDQRLPNAAPHETKFEPQIVITRLSITCTCDTMNAGETCSTLNRIDKQKWTEFMGNLNNGVF